MFLTILLCAPATTLYAERQNPLSLPHMSITNWADTYRASNLSNNMENLARRLRREIGPLQVDEIQFVFAAQASKFGRVKCDVNKMGNDLLQMDTMKKILEPWQRQLLHRATPNVHELVYHTDAAI